MKTATSKNWGRWLREHDEVLRGCGLPSIIIENEQHWQNFLINGYLNHQVDPSHFSISSLSIEQKKSLKNCLASNLDAQEKETSVLWLRLRCSFDQPA